MKTKISNNQRTLNILTKALELGFELDYKEELSEIMIKAEEFLIEESTPIREFCEIHNNGRSQHVHYTDGMGFEKEVDGQIFDGYNAYNKPEFEYDHEIVVNSLGQVVQLYDVQGNNKYNTND